MTSSHARRGIGPARSFLCILLVVASLRADAGPAAGDDPASSESAPMVLVPAGEFLFGSNEADLMAHAMERPQRTLRLDAFYIDTFEVTNAQYKTFLKAIKKQGHSTCDPTEPPRRDHAPATGDEPRWTGKEYPITGIGWYEAAAYCAWAGKRLPTSREWEKAARGTEGRVYPWGDEPPGVSPRGNFRDEGSFRTPGAGVRIGGRSKESYVEGYSDGYSGMAPVGAFPQGASQYGAQDMAGNAFEWVSDRFGDKEDQSGSAKSPPADDKLPWSLIRGGSCLSWPRDLRAAAKFRMQVWERRGDIGFRCANDAK